MSVETQSFPNVLTLGGDDRLVLKKDGTNKYFIQPFPADEAFFRGSCTCNSPTRSGYNVAQKFHMQLVSGQTKHGDIMNDIRRRLLKVFDLPRGTNVVLMPSGSDAEYIPLLVAQMMQPEKKIVNVVTCNEEVGSGTLNAAGGKFFSAVEPIPGQSQQCSVNSVLKGFEGIETVPVNARCDKGMTIDGTFAIKTTIARCLSEGAYPIIHTVMGSKTGIIEKYPQIESSDVLVVVDACQGRFTQADIQDCINRGAIVLFTGSKFFRGPAFSGAVFLPESICSKVKNTQFTIPSGLNSFISKYEIPESWESWRSQLSDHENRGLALRWLCALDEIEKTLAIDEAIRLEAQKLWRSRIIIELQKYDRLQLFDSEDTDTIVSISIYSSVGEWFTKPQLTKIFKWMTIDMSDYLSGSIAEMSCFIGQPVFITSKLAVLRLALGSDSLRNVIDNLEQEIQVDFKILEKLDLLARNYDRLCDEKA